MAKKQHVGPSGLVVVDKPGGLTSHDVVSRVRRLAATRKVGHAGTLDPMATGVLILGVGKATKLLTWIVGESKTYTATIRLGLATVTDDAEGEVTSVAPADRVNAVSREDIQAQVQRLTGEIMQVPSSVSAIKVDGVRSYAKVRSGEAVTLQARPVTITRFEVNDVRRLSIPAADLPDATETVDLSGDPLPVIDCEVTVTCSSGTYIRALARDIGVGLGVGGHLTALRRTQVGQIGLDAAYDLEELSRQREEDGAIRLFPLEDAAASLFSTRRVSAAEANDLANGRRIAPSVEPSDPTKKFAHITAAFAPNGTLVALLENDTFRGEKVAAPTLVFEAGSVFEEKS